MDSFYAPCEGLSDFMRSEYAAMVGRPAADVKAEINKKFPRAVVRIVQPGVQLQPIKVDVCVRW